MIDFGTGTPASGPYEVVFPEGYRGPIIQSADGDYIASVMRDDATVPLDAPENANSRATAQLLAAAPSLMMNLAQAKAKEVTSILSLGNFSEQHSANVDNLDGKLRQIAEEIQGLKAVIAERDETIRRLRRELEDCDDQLADAL